MTDTIVIYPRRSGKTYLHILLQASREHTCVPDTQCLVIIDRRRLPKEVGRPTALRHCVRPRGHAGVCRDQNEMVISPRDYPTTFRPPGPDTCSRCRQPWPCETIRQLRKDLQSA